MFRIVDEVIALVEHTFVCGGISSSCLSFDALKTDASEEVVVIRVGLKT